MIPVALADPYVVGQQCANSVIDHARTALALIDEWNISCLMYSNLSWETSYCTVETLRGYRDTLRDYLEERADR